MPTQTKENYLKAIYFLQKENDTVSLTELGKAMSVSTPTVNNMVKKLQVNGWVKYEKYKPLTLTGEGAKQAALIIRKHRLTEMFLTQVMGFGWEEVHDIAEEMEHLNSEKLFDRMNEMLGFPDADPHGSPIPDKNGKLYQPDYRKLSEVKVGEIVTLSAIENSEKEFLLFLNKKGLELGLEIRVDQIENYDKSVVVSYAKEKEVTLSSTVSNKLLVV